MIGDMLARAARGQGFRSIAAASGVPIAEPEPVRWKMTIVFFALAWAPMLIAASIAVVPSGAAGVRVSETSGTLSGTLYPGVHFVTPLLEHVDTFDHEFFNISPSSVLSLPW